MAHPHHLHREHQVSHRRVHHILKDEPESQKEHFKSHAFSKVTSKTAAEHHDDVAGAKRPKRYARGGKVKGNGPTTNIIIASKPAGGTTPPVIAPPAAGPGPGGPPMPPGPPPPGAGGPPPGMPMRARGGKVIEGASTKADIKKWSKRASENSYFRGGAATGVGREEKANRARRK